MSALDIHMALHNDAVTGTARLALLVMALHADHKGRVAISARDLGEMCAVSPQAASSAVHGLVECGAVTITEKGKGTAASVYRLTRDAAAVAPEAEAAPVVCDDPTPETRDINGLAEQDATPAPVDAAPKVAPSIKPTAPATPPASVKPAREAHRGPALPPEYPQNDVGRVLYAAGIKIDPKTPFYWHSRTHQASLAALVESAGSLDAVLERLRAARKETGTRTIRRLAALRPFVDAAR